MCTSILLSGWCTVRRGANNAQRTAHNIQTPCIIARHSLFVPSNSLCRPGATMEKHTNIRTSTRTKLTVRHAGEQGAGTQPRARPTRPRRRPSSVVGHTRPGVPHDQRRRRTVPVQLCVVGVFRTALLQKAGLVMTKKRMTLTGDTVVSHGCYPCAVPSSRARRFILRAAVKWS